jgi:hypothetical protein
MKPRRDAVFTLIAIAASVVALVAGLVFGTDVAGGSDSSCYLSEARLLASGATHLEEPLARATSWPAAPDAFTPAGHVPSPAAPGTFVPMCPPGLPLLMAALASVGATPFLVVPILGGLAVWLTFLAGRRIDGALTGAAAAILLTCSPIFLFQVVQPMTDVPAATWWLLAIVFAIGTVEGGERPFAAGLAAAMAVMTRPNLLPLAGCLAAYFLWMRLTSDPHPSSAPDPEVDSLPDAARGRRWDGNAVAILRPVSTYVLGLLPGIVVVALLQHAMYGSALLSGYGSTAALFSPANIVPNLRRYPAWLFSTHTPLLLAGLAAPVALRRPSHAWLCLSCVAATLCCYLPYYVFEDWWYIRFLLPAIPLLIVLSLATMNRVAEHLVPRMPALVLAGVVLLAASWSLHQARIGHAFDLRDWERHFRDAGVAVAERLPAKAAIITVKNSGSVRYYANRPTVAWDTLAPGALDAVIGFLDEKGYTPYLLLESDEESAFRTRFEQTTEIGALDWPPVVQVGRTVRIYDPHDRARYLSNQTVRTDYVRSSSTNR